MINLLKPIRPLVQVALALRRIAKALERQADAQELSLKLLCIQSNIKLSTLKEIGEEDGEVELLEQAPGEIQQIYERELAAAARGVRVPEGQDVGDFLFPEEREKN